MLILIKYPIPSFVILLTISFINLFTQYLLDWQIQFVYAEVGFSILALLLTWIARFLYNQTNSLLAVFEKVVDLPSEQINIWFEKQIDFIFGSFWAYIISVPFGIAGIWTMAYLGLPWLPSVDFVFKIFWGIFMFVVGVIGWIYLGLLLFLFRFSRLKVKGAPFERLDDEYQDINNIYTKLFIPFSILFRVI